MDWRSRDMDRDGGELASPRLYEGWALVNRIACICDRNREKGESKNQAVPVYSPANRAAKTQAEADRRSSLGIYLWCSRQSLGASWRQMEAYHHLGLAAFGASWWAVPRCSGSEVVCQRVLAMFGSESAIRLDVCLPPGPLLRQFPGPRSRSWPGRRLGTSPNPLQQIVLFISLPGPLPLQLRGSGSTLLSLC